jgi:hypothetical protein
MKARVILTCGVILLTGCLFWYMGDARAQTTAREVDTTSRQGPPWRFRCIELLSKGAGKNEFSEMIPGKAWIHSIVYATAAAPLRALGIGASISGIVFELSDAPKEVAGRIAAVFAEGASPGQIDLDIVVTNGLWIRGEGHFTVLYKPLD